MKERPIIMGADSVRAILEGRKTQTRRVINPRKSVMERCPYGKVGDRLWVRETFKIADSVTVNGIAPVLYKADCSGFALANIDRWESPMFMPRKLSRITLEITDIRVERVQDITAQEAIAEGVRDEYEPISMYRELWQKLNAKRGYPWEKNPWVWVISFKVVQS